MKESRYTEPKIIGVLKEVDAGKKVEEKCRQHGISSATYYNWKFRYGGIEASDVKRLKLARSKWNKLTGASRTRRLGIVYDGFTVRSFGW